MFRTVIVNTQCMYCIYSGCGHIMYVSQTDRNHRIYVTHSKLSTHNVNICLTNSGSDHTIYVAQSQWLETQTVYSTRVQWLWTHSTHIQTYELWTNNICFKHKKRLLIYTLLFVACMCMSPLYRISWNVLCTCLPYFYPVFFIVYA